MITAVDSSVLLDLFTADPMYLDRSRDALLRCSAEGSLIACDVVWAEVGAQFESRERAWGSLETIDLGFSPVPWEAALLAGTAWAEYRRRGGSRTRVVADFLIGAHAQTVADRLVTRDRGFFRSYFGDLVVIDPSSP